MEQLQTTEMMMSTMIADEAHMEVSQFKEWLQNTELSNRELEAEISKRIDIQFNASREQGLDKTDRVERLFICMGMVKRVIESDKLQIDPSFLKHLLTNYDLPSSLKICELLLSDDDNGDVQSSGAGANRDRIKQMAERALIIDPQNTKAKQYLHKVVSEGKQKEKIEETPAQFIFQSSIDLIIKILILMPYAWFHKIAEPRIFQTYERNLRDSFIFKFPILSQIIQLVLHCVAKIFDALTYLLNKVMRIEVHEKKSGQNHLLIVDQLSKDLKNVQVNMKIQ